MKSRIHLDDDHFHDHCGVFGIAGAGSRRHRKQMSELVNWGRWPVALLFALQGLALLIAAVVSATFVIREGAGLLYPAYQKLIESTAFLLCSWGLVKMRYWAYWLAAGIRIFEIAVIAVVFLSPFKVPLVFAYVLEGTHFQLGSILKPLIIPCVCLVWLFLPSVRAQYSQKELAA